jgi:hypothetical protein
VASCYFDDPQIEEGTRWGVRYELGGRPHDRPVRSSRHGFDDRAESTSTMQGTGTSLDALVHIDVPVPRLRRVAQTEQRTDRSRTVGVGPASGVDRHVSTPVAHWQLPEAGSAALWYRRSRPDVR